MIVLARRPMRSDSGLLAIETILSGDRTALAKLGEKGLLDVVAATHSGMSVK